MIHETPIRVGDPKDLRHNVTTILYDRAPQPWRVSLAWKLARYVRPLRDSLVRYAERHRVLGPEIKRATIHNVVTTVGKTGLTNYMMGLASENAFIRQALGTDNTSPAAGNTALGAETSATGMARKDADTKTLVSTSTMQLTSTWTNGSGGTVAVREAGIFNTKGTMLARSLTSAHDVGDGQSLQIIHQVPFA